MMLMPNFLKRWFGLRGLNAIDPALRKVLKKKTTPLKKNNESDFLSFLANSVRLNDRPYSFDRHEYLQAIAADPAQRIVIRKAAQVGASTLMAAKMLYWAMQGRRVAYYLPTRPLAEDFVRWVVNPIIDNSPDILRSVVEAQKPEETEEGLKRRGKAADTVRMIQFAGGGTIFFRGLQRVAHAKAIPLDCVFLDEVAELARQRDPDLGVDLISFIQDRLMHSDLKHTYEFSQPSIPLMDIDFAFHEGDQKFYLHRCGCGEWICLEERFPATIAAQINRKWVPLSELTDLELQKALDDNTSFTLFCPACCRPLKAEKREWVAKAPSRRDVSSYSISQLYAHLTPREIAARWRKARRSFSEMVTFTISVLGLPHAGDRQPLTEEDLLRACEVNRQWEWTSLGTHFAGIDCGDNYHIVIARHDGDCLRLVWAECTESPERLLSLLTHYNARFIIDAMPYKPISKRLCRVHGNGQLGAILYSNATATSYGYEDEETEPVKVVKVNRTEMLDNLIDAIKSGFLRFPSPACPEMPTLFDHCKKLIRDRNEDGTWTYRRGVENHYAMSMAMMLVGVREQVPLRLAVPTRLRDEDAVSSLSTLAGIRLGGVL